MQGNAISVKFVKIINFLIKRSRVEISRASYELIWNILSLHNLFKAYW